MVIYKISRVIHYTEWYLVQVEDEEQAEDGTITDLIKMDAFSPYFVESEHTDGDTDWAECTEEEAQEIEAQQHIAREIVPVSESENR